MTLLAKIKNIEGYLRDDEAQLLFNLAKSTPGKEAIVEIGSWKGKSTICLALGSNEGAKSLIYAVDPHTGSPEHKKQFGRVDTFKDFQNNLTKAKVSDLVKPLRKTSYQASQKFPHPIKLLFIDGDHSYQAVKQDFMAWSPKVIDGGIIAFHDTISWPGPRKLVLDEIYHSKNYKNIRLLGSITYAQKAKTLTLTDQINNQYALIIRNLRNLIANLPLPQLLRIMAKKAFSAIQ